ncbi:MAG: glycosyltransferase, partial [Tepidisphaeraceae bacterium]
SARVFVFASRIDTVGLVNMEAMASGLPVVATRSAGVELLTRPNFNGHVVETDDADAFGGALLHLAIDEPTRARFGLNARAHSRRFTVQGMVARTLQVYRADAAVPATIGAEQLT